MGSPDFNACARAFTTNKTLQKLYGFTGPVLAIAKNESSQISTEGCNILCGRGSSYYEWRVMASTLTTWVLPILGILLQAPFESNAFWDTVFALARWLGNPIASLSYTLWNIKVTGKCALMVDLAYKCQPILPPQDSTGEYGLSSVRDSFFILATMNQFSISPEAVRLRVEAEGLLRIALFSKDLRLADDEGDLKARRSKLAKTLRESRKRGVVPIYISTLWFIFAMGISIENAFGIIGEAEMAQDLALGCLLTWLPVLILSTIVDRNFTTTEDVRGKLNHLVNLVRKSLVDPDIASEYIFKFETIAGISDVRQRVVSISRSSEYLDNFFTAFAGQGRMRWHYGVAHPILTDIEKNWISQVGRGWLEDRLEKASTRLVLGNIGERGLVWFDNREILHMLTSICIVASGILGAWTLSFFTPTVGLGCRSGGYLIFGIIALAAFGLEIVVWTMVSASDRLRSSSKERDIELAHSFARRQRKMLLLLSKPVNSSDRFLTFLRASTFQKWQSMGFTNENQREVQEHQHETYMRLEARQNVRDNWGCREWSERCLFRPLELINTTWLTYIVMAQTLGSYRTCDCMSSNWASGGGYIDFSFLNTSRSSFLKITWSVGTTISCFTMGIAMIYIVVEWCLQSHLSTEDYGKAWIGLVRTRNFRWCTYPYRKSVDCIIRIFMKRRGVWWTHHPIPQKPKVADEQRQSSLAASASSNQSLLATSPTTPSTGLVQSPELNSP